MNNRPTPETDAFAKAMYSRGVDSHHDGREALKHAKRLERERDDYKWQLHIATGAFEQAKQMERAWRKEETNEDHK